MPSSRLVRLFLLMSCSVALAASLAGCDACGDWPWDEKQKSCHGAPVH